MQASILTYHFCDDYLDKRGPLRQSHFDHLKPYLESGALLLGGATSEPADKGILVFDGLTNDQIETFVNNDPYYQGELVTNYTIQKWNVVAGSLYNG